MTEHSTGHGLCIVLIISLLSDVRSMYFNNIRKRQGDRIAKAEIRKRLMISDLRQ